MRVLSLFSGISSASVAWMCLGFKFIAYAEIDPFASRVLEERIGGLNLGDVAEISDDDLAKLGKIDLIEGGTPCQSMSIAGKRLGLKAPGGQMLISFCDIIERAKIINGTRFVAWENVKGALNEPTNAFRYLLRSLSGCPDLECPWKDKYGKSKWPNSGRVYGKHGRLITWCVVDTQEFGLPQRRQRVFLFADLSDNRGAFKDWPAGDTAVVVRGENRSYKTRARASKKACIGTRSGTNAGDSGREADTGASRSTELNVYHPKVVGTLMASTAGLSRTAGFGAELDFVIVQKFQGKYIARRLLPVECERLQGFPDGWTDVTFNGKPALATQRYKTLGNTMTVRCMKAIGVGIRQHYPEYFT